jgi:4-alpha-glucanotransferase
MHRGVAEIAEKKNAGHEGTKKHEGTRRKQFHCILFLRAPSSLRGFVSWCVCSLCVLRVSAMNSPFMKPRFDFDRRSSGLLMHLTSLPGAHFSGDLGDQAYRFVDFLARAKQTWWQMLPVSPPGAPPGYSPYSSTSAFAGSPWLISLEKLVDEGLLDRSDVVVSSRISRDGASDFGRSIRYRAPRLRRAFDRFRACAAGHEAFEFFCESQKGWLDDFALFSALKQADQGQAWSCWSKDLRLRRPEALRDARKHLAEEIQFTQFVQYQFDRQWLALRSYAAQRGVGLIGDIPIFVAHDSADVWADRSLFLLDEAGRPRTVSGCPPDSFNVLGQMWGHPHYDWPAHESRGYDWWIARFAATYRWFDAARIDHFLGFNRAWHIAGDARDARRGKWQPGPGAAIFKALRSALGRTPIIAEDLGRLTREASLLRDKFHFPGMRVMQFGFGPGGDYHLPHRYPARSVAYTGTHDNSTTVGWFRGLKKSCSGKSRATSGANSEFEKVCRCLNTAGRAVHWDMIRCVMSSVAQTVICPVQDVLGLGDEARMNVPGTINGNWRWRLKDRELSNEHAYRLAELVDLYDRQPVPRSAGFQLGTAKRLRRPARVARKARASPTSRSLRTG